MNDETQDRWRRLVRYLKQCVTLEAARGVLPFGASGKWCLLPLEEEQLVCGSADTIVVTPELAEMSRRLQPGEVLVYGWPTAVVPGRDGALSLAPLIITELEPFSGRTTIGVINDEPYLNPALLSDAALDPVDVVEATSRLESGLAFGDREALVAQILDMANALGLQCDGLNQSATKPNLPRQPGLHNVAVLVVAESSAMTRALLQELSKLEARADWRDTAAAHLFGVEPSRTGGTERDRGASPLVLSDTQQQLVRAGLDDALCVITGPPGTGKSQLVVAMVANSWLAGETLLLSSTNNMAVDVAVERAQEVVRPLLMRTGNKEYRIQLPTILSASIAQAKDASVDEASARRDLALAVKERATLHDRLERMSRLGVEMAAAVTRAERSALRVWGAPVASSDVAPSNALRRAARTVRAWWFKRWRERRLLQSVCAKEGATASDVLEWASAEAVFQEASQQYAELSSSVGDAEPALARADMRWTDASTSAVRACVLSCVKKHESALASVGQSRGGGPSFVRAVERATTGIKAWACTALTLGSNFPLEPGLFDHIIVDEASQCTLAAVLPLAYRAKQLTIVGDPNQLTPVVRLDQRALRRAATAAGLDRADLLAKGQEYGSGSAFTAFEHAVGRENVTLLDEHFRCHPMIARWFNRTFYGHHVTVLTDVSRFPPGTRGLSWVDVEGEAVRGSSGSWTNHNEALGVVAKIEALIEDGSTIGVVTPFAAQAALIAALASRRLPPEALAACDFTSGTAHRFQGNERDVILFSTVIAPGIGQQSARWVEQQRNLTNVAVSRARRLLMVFGHPTAAADFGVVTLASLRTEALDGPEEGDASWKVHSEAEGRLLQALYDEGLAPVLKPVVEGFELDFALLVENRKINIEVDASQHVDVRGRQRRRDRARDRVLQGLGWEVLRYSAWRCLREPALVAKEIKAIVQPTTSISA